MQQHKRTDRRRPPARTSTRAAPRPRIRAARAGEEANRRGDIVRAAARLFRERGFDATTVRDIAQAVGMRSGSPFYHFETKQDILLAVVEEGLAAGLDATEGVLAERLPPREKFHALVRAHLEILLDEGHDFISVLLYDWRSLTRENRAKIVALKDRYDAVWQQVVRELKRAGLLHTDSPLARLLVLGAINFMATWYRRDGALGLDALADQTVDFFLGPAKR
ncbi:MAG: TetR/AcrR family transcriptional regulator [Burkholderiales bacterium]|jgi:AcrR family transcriptional regulator|nr:TetR/AcrR family transcriptional regulator [Burkholderiales bacterium]